MPLTFTQAKAFVIPFGKFGGRTIDDAATTDEGLQWLDWILGQGIRSPDFRQAVEVYLADEGIAKDLAEIVDSKRRHR